MKYWICLPWNGFFATREFLWGILPVRLSTQHKSLRGKFSGGGGGGQGGQNLPPPVPCSPASRTFNSRLPPFTVLLPTPVNWQSRIIIIIIISI